MSNVEELLFNFVQPELSFDSSGDLQLVNFPEGNGLSPSLPSALPDDLCWIQAFNSRPLLLGHPELPVFDLDVAKWISSQLGETEHLASLREPMITRRSCNIVWRCLAREETYAVLSLTLSTWAISDRLIVSVHSPSGLDATQFSTLARAWDAQRSHLAIALTPGDAFAFVEGVPGLEELPSPDREFQAIMSYQLGRIGSELARIAKFTDQALQGIELSFQNALERVSEGDQAISDLVKAPIRVTQMRQVVDLVARAAENEPPITLEPNLPQALELAHGHYLQLKERSSQALRELSDRLVSASGLFSSAGTLSALVLAQRQAEAAERRAEAADTRNEQLARFQSLAATVAAVFIVPALVAAIYSANVALPARGTTDALISLLAFMLSGGLIASVAVKLLEQDGAHDSARADSSVAPLHQRAIDIASANKLRLLIAAASLIFGIVVSAVRPIH